MYGPLSFVESGYLGFHAVGCQPATQVHFGIDDTPSQLDVLWAAHFMSHSAQRLHGQTRDVGSLVFVKVFWN